MEKHTLAGGFIFSFVSFGCIKKESLFPLDFLSMPLIFIFNCEFSVCYIKNINNIKYKCSISPFIFWKFQCNEYAFRISWLFKPTKTMSKKGTNSVTTNRSAVSNTYSSCFTPLHFMNSEFKIYHIIVKMNQNSGLKYPYITENF